MKVKTIVKFRDLKAGTLRRVGEEFECSEERLEEILKVGPFVEKVEEPEPVEEAEAVEEPEPDEEPAPKKTTRKTASKAAKAE